MVYPKKLQFLRSGQWEPSIRSRDTSRTTTSAALLDHTADKGLCQTKNELGCRVTGFHADQHIAAYLATPSVKARSKDQKFWLVIPFTCGIITLIIEMNAV